MMYKTVTFQQYCTVWTMPHHSTCVRSAVGGTDEAALHTSCLARAAEAGA